MDKSGKYEAVSRSIQAVIKGEPSRTARYATACCLLSQSFEYFYWTGFYLVDPHKQDELVIGPYQGTLGCLRIPFSKGVCGAAATAKQTIIVEDVHAFPGHIACDSATRSEIVVPVLNPLGELAAVLDVDSTHAAAFDTIDKLYLEKICAYLLIGASQN